MKSPKRALFVSTLARLRCPIRFGSEESKMRITKAHNPRLDVGFLNLARRASGKSPAIRSLKIAELDEGDGRVRIPLKVARL